MKDLYRELCESESSIPLFSQAWWLDAVVGDSWDVVVVKSNDQIVGALPYVSRSRWGLQLLTQANLTKALGPWVRPTQKSYPKHLAFEKDVLGELADNLPSYDHYVQNWDCEMQNWLPFYWRGFEQTTLYTYRLSTQADSEDLWKNLQNNIRTDIKKAKNRFGLKVRSGSIEEFMALNVSVFKRQGIPVPYTSEFVARIDRAASLRNARDCLIAEDSLGKTYAAAYIVRSGNTAYYLMGGSDTELRSSGASSLVLWEAIRRQPDSIHLFDFEGSMIEPIERFFRGFGGVQTPYFRVERVNSRALKLLKLLRSLLNN